MNIIELRDNFVIIDRNVAKLLEVPERLFV